jgi:hypothetical protein
MAGCSSAEWSPELLREIIYLEFLDHVRSGQYSFDVEPSV